ncbi:hypothetical protein DCS_02666 [Drechmeria coniospora]|uniref:Uncharacterized protein n=1 Tax=Drechmeria coniospora TaxID=98403 RepID=A0A151GWP9_DRECN|nr:hypothetical protein DCS_02666 [Drechmeria coniospora]KYK61524.1 hypothetical protein DCS_02666 [Drechmeria coniospora]
MEREFRAKLSPASGPHQFVVQGRYNRFITTLTQNAAPIGAAAFVQLFFCALPSGYAIVPPVTFFLALALNALFRLRTPSSSPKQPYRDPNVVPGRATAQLPSPSGSFGTEPAVEGLVVFNLGAQMNHPMGFLCPGGKEIGDWFMAMNADLMRRRDELGLITMSDWRGLNVDNANSLCATYYFRDVESIHRFAYEEMHRKAWDWFNAAKHDHIGIFHETFIVPPHSYETIYKNCVPIGFGKGSVKCKDIKGVDQWASVLVSADTPALKTQMARFNREERGNRKE